MDMAMAMDVDVDMDMATQGCKSPKDRIICCLSSNGKEQKMKWIRRFVKWKFVGHKLEE